MAAPIAFSRSASLGAPAGTLTLSSIPQTAQHLLFRVRARSSDVTTVNTFLGLRINGDSGPNTYDGNTMRFTTSATGQADDGIDLEQFILGNITHSDVAAGIFNEHFGIIPRYTEVEPHMMVQMGFGRYDNADTGAANFDTYVGGGQHVEGTLAAVTSLVVLPETGNLTADTEITVWGLLEDATASSIARSAGTTTIDFEEDEIKAVTLSAGSNTFTFSNPVLGRTITVMLSGGDGSTTITLPGTALKLEDNYSAGNPGVMIARCTNESGPEYIVTIKDVI